MNDREILELAKAMPREAVAEAVSSAQQAEVYWRENAQNIHECHLAAVRRVAVQLSLIADGALSVLSRVR